MAFDGWELGILAGGALTTVVWWGWRKMVDGQENMAKQITDLAIAIEKISGQVNQGLQWQLMHTDIDNMRELENKAEHVRITDLVEKLRV